MAVETREQTENEVSGAAAEFFLFAESGRLPADRPRFGRSPCRQPRAEAAKSFKRVI